MRGGHCVLCLSWSPFAFPRARQVIPPGQPSWLDQTYQGSFTCRVWQFGRWVEVTIDDRLPCLAGRLCFSRCQREDVFWLPLLEKVYAKYACWRLQDRGGQGAAAAWVAPGEHTPALCGLQRLLRPGDLTARPAAGLSRPETRPGVCPRPRCALFLGARC